MSDNILQGTIGRAIIARIIDNKQHYDKVLTFATGEIDVIRSYDSYFLYDRLEKYKCKGGTGTPHRLEDMLPRFERDKLINKGSILILYETEDKVCITDYTAELHYISVQEALDLYNNGQAVILQSKEELSGSAVTTGEYYAGLLEKLGADNVTEADEAEPQIMKWEQLPKKELDQFILDFEESVRRSVAVNGALNTKYLTAQLHKFLKQYVKPYTDVLEFYKRVFELFAKTNFEVYYYSDSYDLPSLTDTQPEMGYFVFFGVSKFPFTRYQSFLFAKAPLLDVSTIFLGDKVILSEIDEEQRGHYNVIKEYAREIVVDCDIKSDTITLLCTVCYRLDISKIGATATEKRIISVRLNKAVSLKEVIVTANPNVTFDWALKVTEDGQYLEQPKEKYRAHNLIKIIRK